MSEAGWYPDPQDDAQKRFWNGTDWTTQVKTNDDTEATRPVLLPSQPAKRSNAVLWSVLVLVLCLLVGSGWWLSTHGGQTSSAPAPESSPLEQASSATASSASPAESASSSVAEPGPSAAPTPQTPLGAGRPRTPEQIAADPASTENPAGLKVGDVIDPTTCPATATPSNSPDASNERIISGGGLSIPRINGFNALNEEPYNFINQSRNIGKRYEELPQIANPKFSQIAVVSIGTLSTSEGFNEVVPAAKRVASCLIALDENYTSANVIDIKYRPNDNAVWLNIRVPITGVEGVTSTTVSIFTCLRDGIMHVATIDVPDYSQEDSDVVWKAFEDMRLS